jgi:hypothetical protein
MALSASELIQARETTAELLERLGLAAYLFEVEPGERDWTVRVECAVDDGWETIVFPVDSDALLSEPDGEAMRELLEEWRPRLSLCRQG